MKKSSNTFIQLLILILSFLILCSRIETSGKNDAERDVKNGILKILIYGELNVNEVLFSKFIKLKYGINLQRVAGCIISDRDLKYINNYNSVMKDTIKNRIGLQFEDIGKNENVTLFGIKRELKDSLFKSALLDTFSTQNFILFTFVNLSDSSRRVVCTDARFLEEAYMIENGIDYNPENIIKSRQILISLNKKLFKLKNPKAIERLTINYDSTTLNNVYYKLLCLPIDSLHMLFSPKNNDNIIRYLFEEYIKNNIVDTIYTEDKFYKAYEYAVAHVLLEKGLFPYKGCFSGYIYLRKEPKEIVPYLNKRK